MMFLSKLRCKDKSIANYFLRYFGSDSLSNERSTPRRTLMYVPGNDAKKITKASTIEADLIVLDCEDGVAINQKESARRRIADMLNEAPFSCCKPQWGVRVNSASSGLCQLDLAAVLGAANKPPCILLPKVESIDEISWFSDAVMRLNRNNVKMDMVIYSETAISMMRLPEIVQAAVNIERKACLRLVALVIGSDDYVASIGASRTKSCMEILYARQRLVMIAKSFNLQAIDMVHIDIGDLDGLRKTSEESATWGFTGRQAIHPSHVPIVQASYSPSPSRVAWAMELVKAFDLHQQLGKGAFVFRDQMIDMPTLRQAQNVVNLANASKMKTS